jgi:pimeloyl-ACP methyl ester carboxylesterase
LRSGAAIAFVLFLSALSSGCNGCRREDDDKQSKPTPAQLPPLASPSPTMALPVPGFADAVTVIPVGATKPVPVLVAVIGIGDTPEEQCAVWRELVGKRAFVLCPRGLPHWVKPGVPEEKDEETGEEAEPEPEPDAKPVQVGFYQPDATRLDKELTAALAALKAKWPQYVAEKEVVYTGFSRGAFLGPQLASKKPDRFKRLVLIEGGHSPWTEETATAFAKGGGKKVLFACGQQSCVDDALNAAGTLGRRKIETKTVLGQGEGHNYKKQVKDELKKQIDWVVDGDPAWK